jgi:3-oxoacyl-[acyl-carrier protein] reductase
VVRPPASREQPDVPIYPNLAGKTAFVTGGSKGIGAATCRLLAANGVKVAVVARGAETAEELANELRTGGADAVALVADCTDAASVDTARRSAEEQLGPVDLLVAFAGGFESFTPVAEMTLEEWRQVLEANLTSTFVTVRAFLPGMIERGNGSIVTMSSISARYLDKLTQAAYAASKAGVIMFTRHLAIEVGPHGIRANCVAPGTTMSERIERVMSDEAIERTRLLSPLQRLGEPDDTANATVFLLSDAASWLTGVTLDVNGGRVML